MPPAIGARRSTEECTLPTSLEEGADDAGPSGPGRLTSELGKPPVSGRLPGGDRGDCARWGKTCGPGRPGSGCMPGREGKGGGARAKDE